MKHLPNETENPAVLVGLDTRDDAGIIKVSDSLAMIQTVDFFTPIVDDPYAYGQIAAANSLSDIYAMGGTPRTALNILGFPAKTISKQVIARIIEGGYHKTTEAGVTILGGHSVKDPELKFGMSVTGFIDPDDIRRNSTAQPGDALVLTKPLGTGILTTALKNEALPDDILAHITMVMSTLNKQASEIMQQFGVNACTDVTGFGLLGHLYEVAQGSNVSARVFSDYLPLLPDVGFFAEAGHLTGGAKESERYLAKHVHITANVSEIARHVLFDPQTSGGLLISLPLDEAKSFMAKFNKHSQIKAALIGEVKPPSEKTIEVV